MKPRTQVEVADFINKSLEPFEGKVATMEQLTEHLTKVLGKLLDNRRRPQFEVKVEDVQDGKIGLSIYLKDQKLAEKLVDTMGKPCSECRGTGRGPGSYAGPEACTACKGAGRVPY